MKNVLCFFLAFFFFACSDHEGSYNPFSESKPYSLEITRTRSYYQAAKIVRRIRKMGAEAFIINRHEKNGEWYSVLSGALKDSSALNEYKSKLESVYHFPKMKVVDYSKLDSATRVPIERPDSIKQGHRIAANKPAVPEEVYDGIQKFPTSDMFDSKRTGIVMLNNRAIKEVKKDVLDLPRGISLYTLSKYGTSFYSVIFRDNIFGDNVTLQALKRNDSRPHIVEASIVPISKTETDTTIEKLADMILKTGNYKIEKKEPVSVKAYTKLNGLKVTIGPVKKVKERSYYLLTDEGHEYIYIAQSTQKSDAEMFEFLSEIGKDAGLVEYDEFYNSFYTIADDSEDLFLGFTCEKLDWRYAESKGNQLWARKMVGYWNANLYFYSNSYGAWGYGLFDLLTNRNMKNIYGNLYGAYKEKENARVIYGVKGRAVYSLWGLSEINLGIGRFVVALNPISGRFSERNLITRAEKLQLLNRGGYAKKIKKNPEKNEGN